VVKSNNPQSGVAVVVGVFVNVSVGVKDAVELGVGVFVFVKVLVIVYVRLCVKVFEGVGDPMNIGGGRLWVRDTRNFSTIPLCAETRWIIGQT
jgi:hypothetical protein